MLTSKQLLKCQAMGEVWAYLDPLEVTKWQSLNKWMYRVAVGRIQTRIKRGTRAFFLRKGSYIVDEVSAKGKCI